RVFRDGQPAGRGRNRGLRRDLSAVECERDGERLEGRARLEEVGDDAVAQLCAGETRAVVRIEGRHIDEREHFAGAYVERDQLARLRAIRRHRALQRAVGETLDLAVDGEREVAAVL